MNQMFSCTREFCFVGSMQVQPSISLTTRAPVRLQGQANILIDRLWVLNKAIDNFDEDLILQWQQNGIDIEIVDSLDPIIAQHQGQEVGDERK